MWAHLVLVGLSSPSIGVGADSSCRAHILDASFELSGPEENRCVSQIQCESYFSALPQARLDMSVASFAFEQTT